MEIEDLRKVYFDSVYPYTIFMIHTTISDVIGTIPMDSIDKLKLPLANYYAMGHIHQRFLKRERNCTYSYPGPIYPNNFQELTDLMFGSFNMCSLENGNLKVENIQIPLEEVVSKEILLESGLTATDRIISEIDRLNLSGKIFLLKLKGTLKEGKTGDIRFNEIEDFVTKKGATVFLRNISAIRVQETEIEIESDDMENIEEKIIEEYAQQNPADFNKYLPSLMEALSIEKNEDEKSVIYENRLLDELKNILELGGIL